MVVVYKPRIIETLITDFSGGMTEEKRTPNISFFSLSKHFDVFTYAKKLAPYYKTVESISDATNYKTYDIKKFLYVQGLGGNYYLYGLGAVAGSAVGKIYRLDIVDLVNNYWTAAGNGQATGARSEAVFFYYKTFIYIWRAGTHLARFDCTEAAVFNNTYQALSYTNVAQPVHHPADDIAYFFRDNIVDKLDNTTFSAAVLTLPSNMRIVSCCPYGDYLAIGCVDTATAAGVNVHSTVFLWDRDSSLTTLSDRIDFGEGALVHLANLNNQLIGVVGFYTDNSFSLDKPRVLIKKVSGRFAIDLNVMILDDTTGTELCLPRTSFTRNNILYFPIVPSTAKGDIRQGIWAVDSSGRLSLVHSGDEVATSYQGIYSTSNMWWIAHSTAGFETTIHHSDFNMGYSTTTASIYESVILNLGDSQKTKKLISVSVMTDKLPTAGQIVLKYRIDGATSWTTIFTNTEDDSVRHTAINIESTGATLPTYKEIEFRVESTGGAVFAGLKYKAELIDDSF